MEFSPTTIALAGLALSIAVHAVAMFFRTPKEASAEIDQRIAAMKIDYDRRITDSDMRITNLSVRFEGSHGRHDQALETLTSSLDKLTSRIDTLVQMSAGNNGTSRR